MSVHHVSSTIHHRQGARRPHQRNGWHMAHFNPKDVSETIARLPKVDLHRHLEGSLTPEMILEIARKYKIRLPANTVEGIKPYVQVTKKDKTLLDFLKKFDTLALLFKKKEAITELTYRVIQDANKDNLKYLELRFAPHYMASASKLSIDEITDAVLDGIKKAKKDFPFLRVLPMLIAVRHLSHEKAKEIVDLALRKKISCVDLASDEFHYPPELFKKEFQEAKAKGLHVTIHAGEARGADSVKTAIEQCGAERIGHGVRIAEDPVVMEEVKKKGIPLEICPTSNVQTGAVPDWKHHPVKKFYKKGIKVTINTDDPGVSGINLSHEYQVLMKKFGFTLKSLKDLVVNGVNAAFLAGPEKRALKKRVIREFDKVVNRG